jgi:hypothetical protein
MSPTTLYVQSRICCRDTRIAMRRWRGIPSLRGASPGISMMTICNSALPAGV